MATRHKLTEAPANVSSLLVKRTGTSRPQRITKPVAPNLFRLGYLIHDVSRMQRTLVNQHMKPQRITRSQWWILLNICRCGGVGIMSSDLAKLLDMGKVTFGGLIDRLEIAGYVYRRSNKRDRRAKHVFISEAGYALIERMGVIVAELNKQMAVGLDQKEIETTERNLILLKDNLRGLLGKVDFETE